MEIGEEYRTLQHFGPYGAVCKRKGQMDSGLCWKCQIAEYKVAMQTIRAILDSEITSELKLDNIDDALQKLDTMIY